MTDPSPEYYAAITADARRILLRAVIDIIDPDIVYQTAESSGASPYSKLDQLHDKNMDALARYETLEYNRWLLNGSFAVSPDDPQDTTGQMGFQSSGVSGEDGAFSPEVWLEQPFSGVSILQACSIYFPSADEDGYPVDFTVDVMQGGTAYFTKTFTGNTETQIDLDGFTVQDPDAIRVTVTRWSLPGHRFRVVEIIPGIYETWDQSMLASFSVVQQANFACLALPYGTCNLSMDNLDRRFEPRNKQGIFKSIEERQGIEISIGVKMPDGTASYQPTGVYYQYAGGWKTGENGLTMEWQLVDIIGLLTGRQYIPPDTLPTTLEGWAASLVEQLGVNFQGKYLVDQTYSAMSLVTTADKVTGKSCGDILLWICQATGTFPRADNTTGKLAIEPYWNEGSKMTLDNMTAYPVMKANDDLAAIIFTLADGTQYVVSGNATASSATVSVENPFLTTKQQALTAARMILSTYGGNQYEITGRGNPASEIGDVDTVWLDESSAVTARRMTQTFSVQNGVLQGCQSTLLQADGAFMFENRAVLTASGSWTAPSGVKQLRVILVGKGSNGGNGTDGSWEEAGVDGADGSGGKVWAGTIDINDGQTFSVSVGDETAFGAYSSANGTVYPYGYTDVASGDSFARTGVKDPIEGSGDGGAGGLGGVQGNRHEETIRQTDEEGNVTEMTITVVDNYPTNGTAGVDGVTGCAVVYWDIPGD